MATLDSRTVYSLARWAGLSDDRAVLFTAIAAGESGFNTAAHNAKPPDDSYGLWQINMLGDLGPDRRRQFGISSNTELLDPWVNATAMAKVSGGGSNARPWSVFTSGAYRAHMESARAGATKAKESFSHTHGSDKDRWRAVASLSFDLNPPKKIGVDGVGEFIGDAVGAAVTSNPLEVVASLVRTLMDPSWWRRIGIGVAGVALLVVAAVILLREPLESVASMTPAGKVLL